MLTRSMARAEALFLLANEKTDGESKALENVNANPKGVKQLEVKLESRRHSKKVEKKRISPKKNAPTINHLELKDKMVAELGLPVLPSRSIEKWGFSPYCFIQEKLASNTWMVLISTIFLNRTRGVTAIPILAQFFRLFPTPESVSEAQEKTISDLMQPLGLHRTRAKRIIRFSQDFLENRNWSKPSELYGIGKYGDDSYALFCTDDDAWKDLTPEDVQLKKYLDWRWSLTRAPTGQGDGNNRQPEAS